MTKVSLEPRWVIRAKGPRTGSPQTYDNHAMNHTRPMAVNHKRRAFPSTARASPAGIRPTIVSVTGNHNSFSMVPAIISATATPNQDCRFFLAVEKIPACHSLRLSGRQSRPRGRTGQRGTNHLQQFGVVRGLLKKCDRPGLQGALLAALRIAGRHHDHR